MGLNLLHTFASTLSEAGGSGVPGGPVGPTEWNAEHQLYFDVNAQTGTSYTLAAADLGALVTLNNSAAVALAVPAAVAGQAAIGAALGFYRGWFSFLKNLGTGTVTLTPASGTINGKATETLASGHYGMLVSDGVNYQLLRSSLLENSIPLPQSYLAGLQLSNDGTSPNTVIDITAGQARDSSNAFNLVSTSAFTKSTAGAWASGSGANGMGSGLTVAASTWYHVHAILLSSGATDFYFDTSITAANAPAGVIAYRRIGSVKTDGSAYILAFVQVGDKVLWNAQARDVNSVTIANTTQTPTMSVPPGVSVNAILRVQMQVSSGTNVQLSIWSPLIAYTGIATLVVESTTVGTLGLGPFETLTNTSGQISWIGTASSGATVIIQTDGYIDRRGRDS